LYGSRRTPRACRARRHGAPASVNSSIAPIKRRTPNIRIGALPRFAENEIPLFTHKSKQNHHTIISKKTFFVSPNKTGFKFHV
jgi:hypothetical protein